VGWFLESRVAPRAFRGQQYVAVSQRTREELTALGVDPHAISVVHNGTEPPLGTLTPRHPEPRVVVLGRVVPHKRIEHALEVVARLAERHPRLRLRVVGDGWWSDRVRGKAVELGVDGRVDFLGHVDERTKHAELASAWVALAPSVKEGWGLCVVEAASHGVPTVAYEGAGGLSESIVHGRTGILVKDLEGMAAAVDRLLTDTSARESLGRAAVDQSQQFTWSRAIDAWESLLADRAAGLPPASGTDAVMTPSVRHERSWAVSRRS
jgi:glycosyltransferase involved in cell wall biosynthesis